MAYGYGSWSQIKAPSTTQSSAGLTAAGDLFNKAFESAQAGLDQYQQAKQASLAKAQAENLARLQEAAQSAAQGGLGEYSQLAGQFDPTALRERYTVDDQLLVDPTKASQIFQGQRAQALDTTTQNLLAKARTDREALEASNLNAFNKAFADVPEASQYIQVDSAGNLQAIGGTSDRANRARGLFEQAATKYGFKDVQSTAAFRESLANDLASKGAKATEIQGITDAVEQYQIDSRKLTPQQQKALDTAISTAAGSRDLRLASIDEEKAAFFKANEEAFLNPYNYEEAKKGIAAAITKYVPDGTGWFSGTEGGDDLAQFINSNRGVGKSLGNASDTQIAYAISMLAERGNFIYDEGVDVTKLATFLSDLTANDLTDANLKRRTEAVTRFSKRKEQILKDYESQVRTANSAANSAAGFRDTKGNAKLLRAINKINSKLAPEVRAAVESTAPIATTTTTTTATSTAAPVDNTPEAQRLREAQGNDAVTTPLAEDSILNRPILEVLGASPNRLPPDGTGFPPELAEIFAADAPPVTAPAEPTSSLGRVLAQQQANTQAQPAVSQGSAADILASRRQAILDAARAARQGNSVVGATQTVPEGVFPQPPADQLATFANVTPEQLTFNEVQRRNDAVAAFRPELQANPDLQRFYEQFFELYGGNADPVEAMQWARTQLAQARLGQAQIRAIQQSQERIPALTLQQRILQMQRERRERNAAP